MKNAARILVVYAAAMLFAATAFAQDPAASPAAPAAPAPGADCEAAKTDPNLYPKWLEDRKGDAEKQKTAYAAGKEFLAKCSSAAADDAYVNAVKKWVASYEAAVGKFEVRKKFEDAAKAVDAAQGQKDYTQLFATGKEFVAAEPENLSPLLVLTNVGVINSTAGKTANKALDPDAISFARRALALVEAGKGTPAEFKLINAANKDEAVVGLNYRLGILTRTTAPGEAANYLLKVAQSSSPLKSEPALYFYLAQAYTDGDYKKLAAEYEQKFPAGQPVPDERKAEYDQYQARLNQIADRIIDAYARAVALNTKTDAASVSFKNDTTATLTNLYKQRHEGSDAGLSEFISGSAARRLPLPSDPVPTPAPVTPPATPATTTGTPAATTTSTTPAATPAATPTPTPKPKP